MSQLPNHCLKLILLLITLKHNVSHSNLRKLLKQNTVFNSWSHLRFGICSYFFITYWPFRVKSNLMKKFNLVTRCLVLFFCQLILCFGTDLFGLTITCFNFPLFSVSKIIVCSWFNLNLHVSFQNNLYEVKVHIFWEGHKILWNIHLTFVLCSASQK